MLSSRYSRVHSHRDHCTVWSLSDSLTHCLGQFGRAVGCVLCRQFSTMVASYAHPRILLIVKFGIMQGMGARPAAWSYADRHKNP